MTKEHENYTSMLCNVQLVLLSCGVSEIVANNCSKLLNISKTKLIIDLGLAYSNFKLNFTSNEAPFKSQNGQKFGFSAISQKLS